MMDWGQLKVVDLRAELRSRSLQSSGLKQELVQRLLDNDMKRSSEETDEQARGPSPTTHTTEDDAIVAFDQEVQAVAGIEHVAEPTAEPSPINTMEEEFDQLQKRKRRSTTPPPDPKRCKANELSPSGSVSTPYSHKVDKVLITAPSTNLPNPPDASDGCTGTEPDGQHLGNSAGYPEDREPAATVSTPIHPSGTDTCTEPEPSGKAGGTCSPRQAPPPDPALHPTTCALYIRELMRPLRENEFKAYLDHVSASTQEDADNANLIELFYTNRIKTHAFVVFSDTSKAIRARSALHNRVWPQECNRKPLWVDFVPAEKVRGWIAEEEEGELAAKHRDTNAKRWEVRYSRDADGNAQATFGEAQGRARRETGNRSHLRSINQHFSPTQMNDNANAVPLGPRRARFDAGNEIPRGSATFPGDPETVRSPYPVLEDSNGRLKATRTEPSISYEKVATGLAARRIRAMRSHYTHDVDRKLGKDDEINRYSFETDDIFVDRGKENFVGIRPPHRDARRYVLRDDTQQSRRRRNSPPQHRANQPRGSGPADGRYLPDTSGDMPRRRFGRDPMVARFGTGANDTPIGQSHRFRQRD